MKEKSLLPILAAAVLFAVTPTASAIPMTYEIGNGSTVTGNLSDPGLVIKTSLVSGLEKIAFTLDDGKSTTFDFFKIWTDEESVNKGEDTVAKAISATLDFDIPDEAFSLSGETFGVKGLLLQSGQIEWKGPAKFTVGDRAFTITLSNEKFNEGLWGLDEDYSNGAIVKATVKQISSSRVSVPDHGSTAILLGLAFLSFAFIRRNVTS